MEMTLGDSDSARPPRPRRRRALLSIVVAMGLLAVGVALLLRPDDSPAGKAARLLGSIRYAERGDWFTGLMQKLHVPWTPKRPALPEEPLEVVLSYGRGCRDVLIGGLKDDSNNVKVLCVRALRYFADPAAVKALSAALGDANPVVAAEAARALGEVGTAEASAALLEALEKGNTSSEVGEGLYRIGETRAAAKLPGIAQKVGHDRAGWVWAAELRERCGHMSRPSGLESDSPERVVDLGFGEQTSPLAADVLLEGIRRGSIGAPEWTAELLREEDATKVRPLLRKALDACSADGGPERAVRSQAMMALGVLRDEPSLPSIEKMLDENDPLLQEPVVIALARIAREKSVPRLLEMLNRAGTDSNAPQCVILALAEQAGPEHRARARSAVMAILEDAFVHRSAEMVRALRRVGDANAVTRMLALPYCSDEIAEAFGRLGDRRATSRLVRWLEENRSDAAGNALARLAAVPGGSEAEDANLIGTFLSRHSVWWEESYTAAMDGFEPETVEKALLQYLQTQPKTRWHKALTDGSTLDGFFMLWVLAMASRDQADHAQVAQYFTLDGHSSLVEPLLAILRSRDNCGVAAKVLGTMRERRAVPRLIASLRGDDLFVRAASATALGMMGDRRAVGALLHTAEWDGWGEARQNAIQSLGEIGDPNVVPALARFLRTHGRKERAATAWALGHFDEAPARAALVGAMSDPARNVREAAAKALGHVGTASELPVLKAAANDPMSSVRAAAVEALGSVGGKGAMAELVAAAGERQYEVRMAAVLALGALGDGNAAGVISPLLREGKHEVQVAAAVALAALGREEGITALAEAADGEDKWQRVAAVAGLARLRTPAALEALRQVTLRPADRRIRCLAERALKGSASGALAAELGELGSRYRVEAARALTYFGDASALPALDEVAAEQVGGGEFRDTAKRAAKAIRMRMAWKAGAGSKTAQ